MRAFTEHLHIMDTSHTMLSQICGCEDVGTYKNMLLFMLMILHFLCRTPHPSFKS